MQTRLTNTTARKIIVTLIKFGLAAIVIYFAAKQVAANWDKVVNFDWTLNFWYLGISLVGHVVTLALFSGVWCLLIDGFGYRVPLKYGFKIAYLTNLGRYIPGKIWQVFGMVYMARQVKIKEEAAVASWVIATIFTLPPAFLVSFGALLLYPELISGEVGRYLGHSVYLLAAFTLLLSATMVIAPNRMFFLFNLLLKLLKRPAVQFELSKKMALSIFAGYFVCWVAFGISFWLFLHAIIPDPNIPLIAGGGAFVLAYQIGFVALFAPGGLGIRELVITGMLTPYIGPIAAGLAVIARLWNMLAELIAAIIALLIKLPSDRSE